MDYYKTNTYDNKSDNESQSQMSNNFHRLKFLSQLNESRVTATDVACFSGSHEKDEVPSPNDYVSKEDFQRFEERLLINERTLIARVNRLEEKLEMSPDPYLGESQNMSLTNTQEKIYRESDLRRDEMFLNDANDIKLMITQFQETISKTITHNKMQKVFEIVPNIKVHKIM